MARDWRLYKAEPVTVNDVGKASLSRGFVLSIAFRPLSALSNQYEWSVSAADVVIISYRQRKMHRPESSCSVAFGIRRPVRSPTTTRKPSTLASVHFRLDHLTIGMYAHRVDVCQRKPLLPRVQIHPVDTRPPVNHKSHLVMCRLSGGYTMLHTDYAFTSHVCGILKIPLGRRAKSTQPVMVPIYAVGHRRNQSAAWLDRW